MLDVHCRVLPTEEAPKGALVLVPSSPFDFSLLLKVKRGAALLATVKNFRNMRQHNKFFALLARAFKSQEAIEKRFGNVDRFRAYLICAAGEAEIVDAPYVAFGSEFMKFLQRRANDTFFEELPDGNGIRVYAPKSMALDKMDGPTFRELYDRVMDVLANEFEIDVDALGWDPA